VRFMILVKSNPELEQAIAHMSPDELNASMRQMEVFNDELRKHGILIDCDGLSLTKDSKRVRFDGQSRTVTDGPFGGDLVAGYWIWELPSMEDAVEWVRRCPNPMSSASEVEIRPYWR
jgi:hypothetical protein